MGYLIIKHLGNPVIAITEGKAEDLERHLVAYREIWEEHLLGNVSGEEVENLDGIVLSAMPLTAGMLDEAIRKALVKVLLNHENRVRALEGKATVTIDQFKDALKPLLGL